MKEGNNSKFSERRLCKIMASKYQELVHGGLDALGGGKSL